MNDARDFNHSASAELVIATWPAKEKVMWACVLRETIAPMVQ